MMGGSYRFGDNVAAQQYAPSRFGEAARLEM